MILIRCPRPTRKQHMVTMAWFADASWHCARCGVHGSLEERGAEIVATNPQPMDATSKTEWARKLASILATPAEDTAA